MADTKISALTAASYLDGSEELPLAQAGANEKATVSQVMAGAFVRLQSDFTLTSTTAAQKLFNATANGALTLTPGCYEYYAHLWVNAMSATAGAATFNILGAGTATLNAASVLSSAFGIDASGPATVAAQTGAHTINALTVNLVSPTAGTAMGAAVFGEFECTAGGTIIPSILLTTAAAAVVKAPSFFRVRRISAASVAAVGNWS